MAIHYNAFISYRHHPTDIRVATEIQRALERFHIPKAVRKNQQGALRLFRDKDELSITSNLSDNITMALENSDYLIVICSVHTKESQWVTREIETFLKTHTYDKVLTVLVDGEPYDTIPEILQFREETDPNTGEVTRIPLEPLSCDWRMERKRAYREELPRLAAVLLGCGYDELRQRQRQYRMRRAMTILGAATAASLCLMAYFLYTSIIIQQANDDLHAANQEILRANEEISQANEEISQANEEIREANIQIQANLDQALRNQSQYLSSAASERFLAGDRLTAISLAMAALPDQAGSRPYVPAAELILSETLGIYETNRGTIAAGILDCGVLIQDFAVSDDGNLLYTVDKAGRITAWDAAGYAALSHTDLGTSECRKLRVVGENLLVQLRVAYGSGNPELCCYSPQGELLWSVAQCADFAMLGDETVLVMTHSILDNQMVVAYVDPVDGTLRGDSTAVPVESGLTPSGFWQDTYVPGQEIALDVGTWSRDYVYLLDPETGTVAVLDPFGAWSPEEAGDLRIQAVSATDQGDVLVMVGDDSGSMNGMYNNMVMTSQANATVLCYRGEAWDLAWRQEIHSYSYSPVLTMAPIPGSDRILCQRDNTLYILDGASGGILGRCQTTANVLSIYVEAEQAFGILNDGSFFQYRYDSDDCYALKFMDADIQQARVANAYFTLTANSTHVTVYRRAEQSQWTPFAQSPEGYIRWETVEGSLMMTLTSRGTLQAFDIRQGTCLWTGAVNNPYSAEAMGFDPEGKEFYVKDREQILAYSTETGEMRTVDIPKTVDGTDAMLCGFVYGAQGRYHYMLKIDNDLYLAVMDPVTGEAETFPFLTDLEGSTWEIGSKAGPVTAGARHVWLWNEGTLYEMDLAAGTVRPLLTELEEYPICQYHPERELLSVCTGNEIRFFRPGGGETEAIRLGDRKGVSVCFREDMLLVVSNDKKLMGLTPVGETQWQTDLHVYTSFYSNCTPTEGRQLNIRWQFTDDGELILNLFGLGNIIDSSQWGVRAYVLNFKTYDALQDRLVCYNNSQLGCFPRYSTAQVMELAREQLGGYILPAELQAYYGIG